MVERKAYDHLVTGPLRRICGDAETFCSIRCFQQVRMWANEFTTDRNIALIFDDRPHKKQDILKIYEVYKAGPGADQPGLPNVVSVSFGSSTNLIPLQAADLIAWEFYHDGIDTLGGRKIEDGYRRKQIARLVKGGRLKSEILSREGIVEMMNTEFDPAMLETMADEISFT
jgi:hypothetical protein